LVIRPEVVQVSFDSAQEGFKATCKKETQKSCDDGVSFESIQRERRPSAELARPASEIAGLD
jgi:hypothetical protein